MITVEDKLNIFHRIVLEKEEKRSTEILEELSKKNDAAIKEYTEKLNTLPNTKLLVWSL